MCPPFCNYGFVMIYLPTICFTTSVNLRLLVANLHKYFYNCKYFLFFLGNSFYGEFSVDLTTKCNVIISIYGLYGGVGVVFFVFYCFFVAIVF